MTVHDPVIEKALLGLVLYDPDKHGPPFLSVGNADWYVPVHRSVAAVIRQKLETGQAVAPDTILSEVIANPIRGFEPTDLVTWQDSVTHGAKSSQYAQRLRELSGRRQLAATATSLVQRLSADDAGLSVREAVEELEERLQGALEASSDATSPMPVRVTEFMDSQNEEHSWLVPGLLERMDRAVITGAEGGGKSLLITQISVCVAGGLHPFTWEPIDPVSVLILDCENSGSQASRRLKKMTGKVDELRAGLGLDPHDWENLAIQCRPGGVDLLKSKDRAWLEQCLAAWHPDLVVLGPLYKLHMADINKETEASNLVKTLDRVRERFGFALITEAHATKSRDDNGRRIIGGPSGSSALLRWPEFGFGIQEEQGREHGFLPWRGQRETRDWPTALEKNPGGLPWKATAEYFDRPRLKED